MRTLRGDLSTGQYRHPRTHFPVFNRQACVACKACERICPQNAIKFVGESITSSEIMEILLRDRDYYLNSGGGVTFSGGEAFTQFEGLMDLLIQCKNEKLLPPWRLAGK